MAAKIGLSAGAAAYPSSNFGVPNILQGSAGPVPVVEFDPATDWAAYFDFIASGYTSGDITVDVYWYSKDGEVTGSVVWEASVMAQTPGDAESVEASGFGSVATAQTTVNGTAKGLNKTTIAVTSTDSVADGDLVRLKLARDADGTNGTDNMAGRALVRSVMVSYN